MNADSNAMHWAAPLIGRPYRRGAGGPDAFDCWGLVRWVFAQVHGISMPLVAVDDEGVDNVAAIKRAAAVSGWRPSGARSPAADDIVLMHGPAGRHVGVIVDANGGLFLLHALERVGVCLQPLTDLSRLGFSGFTYWRREP